MSSSRDKQLADLNTLIDVSRQLGAETELDPLLKSIEQAALKVLDCARATVFLYDRAAKELYSQVATGVERISFPADRGIAGEAAQTRKTINVSDAYADSRFNPAVDKATGFTTRNLLSIALEGSDNQLMGVLQVLNKTAGSFTTEDERLAGTLSALAGVAIQRQLLLEEYAEKQRIERDLDLAREIQRGYLPDTDPDVDGFDIAGWNRPALETGGDAYDYMDVDGQVGLFIADATGHGVGPALMVAECRAYLRSVAATTSDVVRIISTTNRLLADDLSEGRFVTVCLGVLNRDTAELTYLSAGQGPMVQYIAAEDRFVEISADTVPMGILDELPPLQPKIIGLAPGDLFVMLTDGFMEWARPDREQFGYDRVCEVLRLNQDKPSSDIIRILYDQVVTFACGVAQNDDLTAIVIRREK